MSCIHGLDVCEECGPFSMPSHTETIKCPKCNAVQTATVEHTIPFYSYVHDCECGYTIMESEWERV